MDNIFSQSIVFPEDDDNYVNTGEEDLFYSEEDIEILRACHNFCEVSSAFLSDEVKFFTFEKIRENGNNTGLNIS